MFSFFTTPTGGIIKLTEQVELPSLSRSPSCCECHGEIPTTELSTDLPIGNRRRGLDGSVDTEDRASPVGIALQQNISSCKSSLPLIQIINPKILPQSSNSLHPTPGHQRSLSQSRTLVKVNFVYNEYGELVDENDMRKHQTTDQLTSTQILRVIKKHYHHELRNKLGRVLAPQSSGIDSVLVNNETWRSKLSSWDFRPSTPKGTTVTTPEDTRHGVGSHSPRRVLEIGCSDGIWCFNFKRELPEWIVNGVDDTNHWMCGQSPILVKDFMAVSEDGLQTEYFSNVHRSQENPEFTVRNLNHLVAHENPIPHNVYEFIRAREIFDRIESYKTFLEDIRLILKPDGVVEFFEIDPRPRALCLGQKSRRDDRAHKSVAETDWTDDIQDRFKDPLDEELATTTPGWTSRVAERMKANIRPRDGVPAANLKSWLEGAGFWDVKQLIIAIHVGGNTQAGQLLKDFVKYQIELEDEIPKLREDLPKIEMDHLESGRFYLNLHVVTARKPRIPRPGDLLANGERQEMTASKYDAMARFNDAKSSQWKRFDLEDKLTSMMQNLTTLPGAPDTIKATRLDTDEALFPMLGRRSDAESPFHSPPFVTVMMQDRKDSSTTESVEIEMINPNRSIQI